MKQKTGSHSNKIEDGKITLYTLFTCTMQDFDGSIQASGCSLNPEAKIIELGGFLRSKGCQ